MTTQTDFDLVGDARAVRDELIAQPSCLALALSRVSTAQRDLAAQKQELEYEIEPPLRAQAVEGKNAEERERLFREVAAGDATWQTAQHNLRNLAAKLDAAQAERDEWIERGRNARARASLLAALMGYENNGERGSR